jgi:hypothetical protein
MKSANIQACLRVPTIRKGVSYAVHEAIVLQYVLWFALTAEVWDIGDADEPVRARDFRHYLKAVGALQ